MKENSIIQNQITGANFSAMKYLSLISLGFAVFSLFTDFFFSGVWMLKYVSLYKLMDIIFTLITLTSVAFFWLIKIESIRAKKLATSVFPFVVLIWSAVLTGIDFQTLGLSTYIIVLLLWTFFIYLDLLSSVVFFLSSAIVMLSTIFIRNEYSENFLPLLFLLIPIVIFSVLMTNRNYKNKLGELNHKEKIVEMNRRLMSSNETLEKEVKKRTREIQLALAKAEESDRLKSAFLANMSHEIRTPMNGILGFAELLQAPGLTGSKKRDYIEIIRSSGDRMLNTINGIIEISKIESGRMELDEGEYNLNEQVNYIHSFFKPETDKKGLKLSYSKGLSDEESTVITDHEKLIAILTNLVKNAIKFTHSGEIELGYTLAETGPGTDLIPGITQKGSALPVIRFFVRDTGIGIPFYLVEAIFERFIQADTGDKRAYQGSGLGLAISKSYVELLGGKIWVESTEGKGSVFYFTIPFIPGKKEEILKADQNEVVNENLNPVKLKVLIAEDDEISTYLISELLRDFNFDIILAVSGRETIEICRNDPGISLVLMDIRMPDINGYEATRKIREFNKNIIIIAQTAYGLSGDMEMALEAGCNDYISKPINKVQLLKIVQKHLKPMLGDA